jgi:exopolysaccharide biosynthesis WecB/TagA/CpsF family protein
MSVGLQTRDILGVDVVAATAPEAITAIDARLGNGGPLKIAYLNAHGSNLAGGDAAFRDCLRDFMVLNDGSGLDAASLVLYGARFPENLNGTDFTPRFLRETRHSLRVFLLGAAPGIAEAARERLRALAPQHDYCGARDGFFTESETVSVTRAIRESGADFLIVAMGNPKQEIWIARHAEACGVKGAIGVGALFDFLAGRVTRAPSYVRAAGFEWVWRLGLEPGRLWRRYILGNPLFLLRVAKRRLFK